MNTTATLTPSGLQAHPDYPQLFVLNHPLIQHKLSHMRDERTSTRTFRGLLRELTLLMGYEITRDLPMTTERISTPLVEMDAPVIAGKKIAIVPVLRAGLGMADGLMDLIPSARQGHIGMYRGTDNRPVEYYVRLPEVAGRLAKRHIVDTGAYNVLVSLAKQLLGCRVYQILQWHFLR